MPHQSSVTLSIADAQDRQSIYALRHDVYAHELRQHRENRAGVLTDILDEVNTYLVAKRGPTVVGFVAITPPNPHGYSVDKYFARRGLPFVFDNGLYEVRLLTVVESDRRTMLATLLMYGALRYMESRGARVIVAIGRRQVVGLYERAGLRCHGLQVQAGAVTYELMSADVRDLRSHLKQFGRLIQRFEQSVEWRLDGVPYRPADACVHGGAFWEAIGDSFETLERKDRVISADVLDAWFDPAPGVVRALERCLTFALKTSPPTGGEGMRRVIARARGVEEENILTGAGSSDLIFAALRGWVTPSSRVLILDPMYAEYAHVLERVIGARVDRLTLSRSNGYQLEPSRLADCLSREYDWVIAVNPNSPTGRHLPRREFETIFAEAPETTRFWIDETYVDFVGQDESLEALAAASSNVVVVKSMSKAYALSGVRAAYLCGPPRLIAEARRWCPPWAVSLPGQIAACEALACADYYRRRWQETGVLRSQLQAGLEAQGWDVVPGCANFLLCHLPFSAPDATRFVAELQTRGLFIRDVSGMGPTLGRRAVRIAVKDRPTNERMLTMLAAALNEAPGHISVDEEPITAHPQ
jgi:histidinol-phosphate/aromatic aminotransferase/cobyric acid decarboxylase-like protein/N-acyl-L-homoserine lactone synthetase